MWLRRQWGRWPLTVTQIRFCEKVKIFLLSIIYSPTVLYDVLSTKLLIYS